jgi:hypothetical protein
MQTLLTKTCQRLMRGMSFVLLFLALTACAGGSIAQNELVFSSLTFDVLKDSPNAELIDYRYGTSQAPVVANPQVLRDRGTSSQRSGTSGYMRLGDELYVKWRLKDTGKIYEDTVDLKSRLPKNFKNQTIYFIIDEQQLYVYLISFDPVRGYLTKEEAEADDQAVEKKRYRNLSSYARNDVVQIYPTRFVIYPFKSVK